MKTHNEVQNLIRSWLANPEFDMWMEPGFECQAEFLYRTQCSLQEGFPPDLPDLDEAKDLLAKFTSRAFSSL